MAGKSSELIEDATIGATARVHGLQVATRNEDDFRHFQVTALNPFGLKHELGGLKVKVRTLAAKNAASMRHPAGVEGRA